MDYFVKGRVLITNETQLTALLESQESMQAAIIKNGQARRGAYTNGASLFMFEIRAFQQGGALVYFNELKNLMIQHSVPGIVHWHECNHDEGTSGCTYNGSFEHLGGA